MAFRFSFILILLLLSVLESRGAQNYYVAAPNALRINGQLTVGLAFDDDVAGSVETADIIIKDYPGKKWNLAPGQEQRVDIKAGLPKIYKANLTAWNFPPDFINSPGFPKLVSMTVNFKNFSKEFVLPLSKASEYLFIQTDKQRYRPKEKVYFFIIPLQEDMLPTDGAYELEIKDPRNRIVKQKFFNERRNYSLNKYSYVYTFPMYPVFGEWSATVRYGFNLIENATVHFLLEDYVQATFNVDIKASPRVISPHTTAIEVKVIAKYVYKEGVEGVVSFRVGVKKRRSSDVVYFVNATPKALKDGSYDLKIEIDDMKHHKEIGWFPEIEGSLIVAEATVFDANTGTRQTVVATGGYFLKDSVNRFLSFTHCPAEFKPDRASVAAAQLTYADGSPATDYKVRIRALADDGTNILITPLKPENGKDRYYPMTPSLNQGTTFTDEYGKVSFEIRTKAHQKTINLTMEDIDSYDGKIVLQATCVQRAYETKNAYIAIQERMSKKLGMKNSVGDIISTVIHYSTPLIRDRYYMVVARGQILTMKKITEGRRLLQTSTITKDMAPSFRIVVFGHYNHELIADSLKFEVNAKCDPIVAVLRHSGFSMNQTGDPGEIFISGIPPVQKDNNLHNMSVMLLGMDTDLYHFSQKSRITQSKIFDAMASRDLGCVPGGGLTINSVLDNAGITIGGSKFTSPKSHSCHEIEKTEAVDDIGTSVDDFKRRKRQAVGGGRLRQVLGEGDGESELIENELEEGEFIENGFKEVDDEKDFSLVKDFSKSWIYELPFTQHYSEKANKIELVLPHRNTEWITQAISVSSVHGICVTEDVLFRNRRVFVDLNFPNSVVRNTEVEIQATVYNYGIDEISVAVYMQGEKDLCLELQTEKQSERKYLVIDKHSASTVSFYAMPVKVGYLPVKVAVLTPHEEDVIEKQLHVISEGITKEIEIPVTLDPANQRRRSRFDFERKPLTDHIYPTQYRQITTVKLAREHMDVYGSASCSITIIGGKKVTGNAVNISMDSVHNLLGYEERPPFYGDGVSNVLFLAWDLNLLRYLTMTGDIKQDRFLTSLWKKFISKVSRNQLEFRKLDGSFLPYRSGSSNKWFTALVMKVLCQVSEIIEIEEDPLYAGLAWLEKNQEINGSFVDENEIYGAKMMGSKGVIPQTAFTLIAIGKCKSYTQNLPLSESRAVAYLEANLMQANEPLDVAIMAYALSLSDSKLKQDAYDKLLRMAEHNTDINTLYWPTKDSDNVVEIAGYGLLTSLLFNDINSSHSIVNWLNNKHLHGLQVKDRLTFQSIQNNLIALEALLEYSIRSQAINLVVNITSSNDINFSEVLKINNGNKHVFQDVSIDMIGETIHVETTGYGIGSMLVKLRYNEFEPTENICEFDVTVNVENIEMVPCVPDAKHLEKVSDTNQEYSSKQLGTSTPSCFNTGNCYCTYNYNKRLMQATVRNRKVEPEDRVEKGEIISFQCLNPGMHMVFRSFGLRIYKEVNLTCSACERWEEYDLPACEVPQTGDSFIVYDSRMKIKPNGIVEVPVGSNIVFECVNEWGMPVWKKARGFPEVGVAYSYSSRPTGSDSEKRRIYSAYLNITYVDQLRIGIYECYYENDGVTYRKTRMYLEINAFLTRCSKFELSPNLRVNYSDNASVGSMASFYCSPSFTLIGSSSATCLRNRTWDHPSPFCQKYSGEFVFHEGNSTSLYKISVCVGYFGTKDVETTVVHVGLFTDFRAISSDLKALEDNPNELIQSTLQTRRGVVFYAKQVSRDKSYCFSFHVIRKYDLKNEQRSVIKVYDYSNPNATCRKFYSAGSINVSPEFGAICRRQICHCVESAVCPPTNPFSEINYHYTSQRREELKKFICENYDYAWRGKISGRITRRDQFFVFPFTIENVIKSGFEDAGDIQDKNRTLYVPINCDSKHLSPGVTYLILGKDLKEYMRYDGSTCHCLGISWIKSDYILDHTSIIYRWISMEQAKTLRMKKLQSDLNYITENLEKYGCKCKDFYACS